MPQVGSLGSVESDAHLPAGWDAAPPPQAGECIAREPVAKGLCLHTDAPGIWIQLVGADEAGAPAFEILIGAVADGEIGGESTPPDVSSNIDLERVRGRHGIAVINKPSSTTGCDSDRSPRERDVSESFRG